MEKGGEGLIVRWIEKSLGGKPRLKGKEKSRVRPLYWPPIFQKGKKALRDKYNQRNSMTRRRSGFRLGKGVE